MIFQERSPLFRLVVLIVFYTGRISVTRVGKFRLDVMKALVISGFYISSVPVERTL